MLYFAISKGYLIVFDLLLAINLQHGYYDFLVVDLGFFDFLGTDHGFQHPYNGPPKDILMPCSGRQVKRIVRTHHDSAYGESGKFS